METINGSIEIIRGGESIGVVGLRWNPETVPVVLETLHGITALDAVDPEAAPTGRAPAYQWVGVDAENQLVTVYLWPEIAFDETAIGQAIAASLEGGEV